MKKPEFVDVKLNSDAVFNASSASYLLQSMTNTDTNDVESTVHQIFELVDSGADLVRVAVPGLREIEALRDIRREVVRRAAKNYNNKPIPLVADVHFLPEITEKTAEFVEKVRINPGNFSKKDFETMALRAKPLFEICKKNNTIIRVGVNQGSLSKRIETKYGKTSVALVESALEWIKIAEMYNFYNIIFSIKSSHVKTMMDANLLLYSKMKEQGRVYPFHLGITEAANEMEGRVKSAIGIGGLLLHGLGNTFRVSLTENPVHEIAFSKLLVSAIQNIKQKEWVQFSEGILTIYYPEQLVEKWWAGVGALLGKWWLNENINDIIITNPYFDNDEIERLKNCLLQIMGIKKTYTEIIACPSCGRTQYDIQSVLSAVKQEFTNYPNLKIAVMGCVVNGPGEMADADFGIIGSANEKVAVYKGKKRVSGFVSVPEALKILKSLINH